MTEESYEDCLKEVPELEQVVPEQMWNYVTGCDRFTRDAYEMTWDRNTKKNLKRLYKKHRGLPHAFLGFCKDKALIGVGAGPSLRNNIHHLEDVYRFNAQFRLNEQPFVIAVCNHQFKPLLKRGIFPHFVFLTDGGDHIYDQLCTDIPELGQATILVASIYADHKTLRDWDSQGRMICFTMPSGEIHRKLFEKYIKEDPEPLTVGSGGNVLNNMFMTGLKILHARNFIALGNDLSYPYSEKLKERRDMFYADGDYSVNLKKGVDEAKDRFTWVGFKMRDNPFEQGKKIVEFNPVGTSRQLFVYKIWTELHVTSWARTQPDPFIYYNCSESGIAGVLAKDMSSRELMDDPKNYYLMDEVVPKRWRTLSFLQAINQILEARLICQNARNAGIGNVIISPQAMAGVSGAGLSM